MVPHETKVSVQQRDTIQNGKSYHLAEDSSLEYTHTYTHTKKKKTTQKSNLKTPWAMVMTQLSS